MHRYTATVSWQRGDEVFTDNRYSRAHVWSFDGGTTVPASSSPLSVPLPMSVAANVDPEEALVAATSSCHMLFFLSIAAQRGFVIDTYVDRAIAQMEKRADGKVAITLITLRPDIRFAGDTLPSSADIAAMHHEAHDQCYVANSLTCDVVVENIAV